MQCTREDHQIQCCTRGTGIFLSGSNLLKKPVSMSPEAVLCASSPDQPERNIAKAAFACSDRSFYCETIPEPMMEAFTAPSCSYSIPEANAAQSRRHSPRCTAPDQHHTYSAHRRCRPQAQAWRRSSLLGTRLQPQIAGHRPPQVPIKPLGFPSLSNTCMPHFGT
jgi:hypothetical protein